jgi:hypothetical protein
MKTSIILIAVATLLLGLSAGVQAAAADPATVTKAALPSSISDGVTVYPVTCDETQVTNGNQRKETFECTFDAGAPPGTIVCDTSFGCLWFSDFDGALATSTHFVITASGRLEGWALY